MTRRQRKDHKGHQSLLPPHQTQPPNSGVMHKKNQTKTHNLMPTVPIYKHNERSRVHKKEKLTVITPVTETLTISNISLQNETK